MAEEQAKEAAKPQGGPQQKPVEHKKQEEGGSAHKKWASKETKKPEGKKEARGPASIIRIAGKDVNGTLRMDRALDQVKGIGTDMANALAVVIQDKLAIPRSSALGELTEEQVESIEDVIKNPAKYGVPDYLLNRRKDMETGKNVHVVSNDLLGVTRLDINRGISTRTWTGYRHQYGQKVRGQRTRSTGRTGRTIGVTKKAEAKAGAPAAGGATPAAAAAAPAKEVPKDTAKQTK
jgi:small subunit ribosomal protein S13